MAYQHARAQAYLINGWAYDTILENYPQLKRDDILAALRYASEVLKEERVFPLA